MTGVRRITVVVLAIGIALMAGCGGEDDSTEELAVEPCPARHSTLPVLAIRSFESDSLRVVAPGEACGFAIGRHEKVVYVELRKAGPFRPMDYESLQCYDLALRRPIGDGLKTTAISHGKKAFRESAEVASLLNAESCELPSQQQASFVID